MKLTRAKLREMIKEIIAEGKRTQFQIPVMDKLKLDKGLKKLKLKVGKDYDIGVGKGSTFILDVDNKHLDKVTELIMVAKIRAKGL